MNQTDYLTLLASLDQSLAILDRNRTPDPAMIAAYDTLKQARARVVRAVEATRTDTVVPFGLELAAA
jgi:hypothetical protein